MIHNIQSASFFGFIINGLNAAGRFQAIKKMSSVSVHPSVLSNQNKTESVTLASMKEAWTVVDRNSSRAAGDDLPPILHTKDGDYKQQSIQEWLNMSCTLHANEHRPQSPQRTGIMRTMNSVEDDLMLGVEATLYPNGMQNMSVQEYLRTLDTCSEKHPLTRWNSVASATSVTSGPKSVVELLDLWHDDPEELLIELGFGKEDADISTKIPVRYINSSSVATGINLGVFLDAQKLRMEKETTDLYSRFRQLEALQKAHDVFSLFPEIDNQNLSPELITEEEQHSDTTENCTKMLRKVSQNMKDSQNFIVSNEKPSGRDRRAAFQRAHQSIPEDGFLAPLTVEQNEAENKAPDLPLNLKDGQHCTLLEMADKSRDRESRLITSQAKKLKFYTSDQPPDSLEMEEVQSFDEDSCPRMTTNKIFLDMKRENSCQSDSSGFLEEPFIPQQPDKDTSKHENVLRGRGVELRDAFVQTDENTGECATERCQHDQVKNFTSVAFQSGRLLRKSMSLDTGLHNIEENAQELTVIPPAHCHYCHHCYCLHHHCSSTWFNGKDAKCQSKTAVSNSERQLIKTLQQLQQTAKIISVSPHAIQEIETMKKSLQGFRNRLVDLEQDIIEQQASVYSVLTEDEREDVKRLQTLRRAVRQEVTELEVQLEDRSRQLGEGMGMFQSLVEEQSSFCSYIDVLRQTGDATSTSWSWPSSSCTIPAPAPATTSQEVPVPPVSGLSPAPSASNKNDTESDLEADKGAGLKAKKQNLHSEMLDFRTILQTIKQSFKQLRSASPEPTESINH
ncbi:protein ITPRID1-like isoform X9 [Carcharodon carcharias]|uniref:protein ITPRID1-like isoform X9 n=1 Tax=Carcharodon carcharias TaxID=13397 RepID=UPI001B7E3DC2|nr:protein ITPRID1-like isoform X9 [Carcharodon carcharias]